MTLTETLDKEVSKTNSQCTSHKRGFSDTFWLQWHATDKCNLNCAHCYRDTPKKSLFKTLEMHKLVEEYAAFLKKRNLTGRIQFGGGEPLLLNKKLFSIIKYARKFKITCRILSNGTLLTKSCAHTLEQIGVRIVQVSVDGGKEIHEQIRGKGSFKQAMDGIKNCAEVGIRVTVAATLSQNNVNQIDTITRNAIKVGASRISFSRLVPWGSGAELANRILTPNQWLNAQLAMNRAATQYGIALMQRDPTFGCFFSPSGTISTPPACTNCLSGCAAGYNGMAIEPDGTVYPCRRLPIPIGNCFSQSLDEIWEHPIQEQLRRRDQLKGNCGACNYLWLCGGCRAIAHAVHKDYMEGDPQCPLLAGPITRTKVKIIKKFSPKPYFGIVDK